MNVIKYFVVAGLFLSSQAHAILIIKGDDAIEVHGAENDVIIALETASVTTYTGTVLTALTGDDNSKINVYGGEFLAALDLQGNTMANIWNIDSIQQLIFGDNAEVNIYGSDFSYSDRVLSGNWQNGNAFSFKLIPNPSIHIPDANVLPEHFILHNTISVPEGSALAFFAIALFIVAALQIRKKPV